MRSSHSERAAPFPVGDPKDVQLASTNDLDIKQGICHAQGGLTVYRGTRLLGFVVTRRHGFDAIRAGGESLGRFNREHSAALALLQEAEASDAR